MSIETKADLDNLVDAIRREAAQLADPEDKLFSAVARVQSSERSLAEIDSTIHAAMRAVEQLVASRRSVRGTTRNPLKKLYRKFGLAILDRLERRRCQAELALLQVTQHLQTAQQQLRADFQNLRSEVLEYKAATEVTEASFQALKTDVQSFQTNTDQALVRQFNHLQRQIDRSINTSEVNQDLERLLESFYCQFEAEYRGSSDSVRHRLRPYRDRLTESPTPLIVVDLGCGRGEWLTMVRDLGHFVQGVDCNPEFVEICHQQELKVELADAGAWLHDQPDQSVDVVSAFHVIEHLPFSTLADWIQQIYRILKPQGWLLLETPNMSQFHVGLVDFYRDPTHIQRIHPQTIQTLLECCHFSAVETAYVNANGEAIEWLPAAEVKLQDPGQYGALPADLAIVARKTISPVG